MGSTKTSPRALPLSIVLLGLVACERSGMEPGHSALGAEAVAVRETGLPCEAVVDSTRPADA